jgi:endonuclease YncB( thermonuclease family)
MYRYKAKILSVYDGDGTFDAEVDMGMNLFQRKDLRLYGCDTPEMRGSQHRAGVIVRDFVRDLILNKTVIIRTHKDQTGKYGRLLVDIIIHPLSINSGNSLAQILIDKGYAKPYFGGKKEEWSVNEIDKILGVSNDTL